MGISVSEVAAVLNVLIIFIQYTLPLFVALIAVAIVENTNNAATWSVFGQLINSTKWPSLLRTDSASKRRVSKRIIYLSLVATIASVLTAIVSAVAPLGLHNDSYATNPEPVPFSYVHDESAIGAATASQGTYKPSRRCGGYIDINCPGSYGGYITFANNSGYYADVAPGVTQPYIDTTVAPNITEAFTSATSGEGNTLASVFDIRYRMFYNYGNKTIPKSKNGQWLDQGRPHTIGVPRMFNSMILNDKIEAVEGLVVDTVKGGIGFRNHTLPPTSHYGTTWSEDILWLDPEIICVNLNVSLDYTMPEPYQIDVNAINPRLTDRGGIVQLSRDKNKDIKFGIGQSEPQLYQRAYLGAIGTVFNILTGLHKYNAPRKLGTTYPIRQGITPFAPDQVTFVQFSYGDSSFIMPTPIEITDPLDFSYNSTPKYFDAWTFTQGYTEYDITDINRISATTGLMLGAGIQVDESGHPLQNAGSVPNIAPGTHWTQPLFSCAAAVKASVKTASFRMEGDASISNLQVEQVVPRKYAAGESLPIWAMEKTGLMLKDFNPYWGLVSSEYKSSPHLQTVQSDSFYLPATAQSADFISGGAWGSPSVDSNAGGRLPTQAMVALWTGDSDVSPGGVPDYSGRSSFPMFQKWSSLSRDASTAGKIISLMWTDLMANGAVGAKGLLSSDGSSSATTADQTAVVYDQGVQYNWVYAIPGFFLLFLYLLLLSFCLTLLFTGRISIELLKYMLNQTSAGRAITAERYGHRDENAAPTRYWADTVGSEHVRVIKQVPQSSLGYEGIEMITNVPKSN